MIAIKTLSELYDQVKGDLETQYGGSIPLFGKIFLRALAAVQAGKLKLLYLALGGVQKNIFVDTAEPEASGGTLERFGRVKLGRNPFSASAGEYRIEVTGTVGAVIETGTLFKSNDDATNPEKLFIVDSDFELTASTDNLIVRALEAGLGSQMFVSEGLTATIPIDGVDRAATVLAETTAPLAAEDLEDYRDKTVESFRTEANGGAASDYRLWSKDAQGVLQAYAYARGGFPSEVNLYIEATIVDSIDGKGTPSSAMLTAVEDVVEFDPDTTKPLDERGRRPLTAIVNFLPIVVRSIDITINGYVGATAEIETLIENAIREVINQVRPFVAGADILADKNNILDTNKIISAIISAKPGSIFGSIVMEVDSTPDTSIIFTDGDIPFLESVIFV